MSTLNTRVVRRARKTYGLTVYRRWQWGSRYLSLYDRRRSTHPVKAVQADTLAQHISVTRDDGTLPEEFKEQMRIVEEIGMDRFGVGFPYNWGVDMTTGAIGEGMPLDAKGAHTLNKKGRSGYSFNQNYWARAIACLGLCHYELTEKGADAIARLIAAMQDEGALTDDPDYKPHSFFAAKACPCDSTRNQMDDIYRHAQELRHWAEKRERSKMETYHEPEWGTRIGEWSLKYNASARAQARAVKRLCNKHKLHVVALTEAGRDKQRRALARALGRNWTVAQQGEYILAWRNLDAYGKLVKRLSEDNLWVLSEPWKRHRRFRVASFNFQHNSGRRVRFDVFHSAAGVQDGDDWSDNDERVEAAKAGFKAEGERTERMLNNDPNAAAFILGDSNLDQFRPVWGSYLQEELKATSMWAQGEWKHEPGSHRNRLIDGIWAAGEDVECIYAFVDDEIRRPRGTDHKPVISNWRL